MEKGTSQFCWSAGRCGAMRRGVPAGMLPRPGHAAYPLSTAHTTCTTPQETQLGGCMRIYIDIPSFQLHVAWKATSRARSAGYFFHC